MNTCKTCKHWKFLIHGDETSDTEDAEEGRYWDLEHGLDPIMVCDHPKLKKFVKPDANGVSVMDGSFYRAMLHTGPDFGCIHHEPKDQS